jgi:acetyltransferase
MLYETPSLPSEADADAPDRASAEKIIHHVRDQGRTILTEYESKKVLAAYGIPITDTEIAVTPDAAVDAAEQIGYPVVVKLLSRTITHKTDVGGVALNLKSADAVREAFVKIHDAVAEKAGAEHFEGVTVQPMINWSGYELIVGSSVDPQFGPVLLFGMGGQLVEVFRDKALALPPLNTSLALHLIDETKISHALKGVRGRKPVDREVLASLLVRFSELVAEQPRIAEIDINPLLASPERVIALDARVVLHPAEVADKDLPRLAIRPYPYQYEVRSTTDDGTPICIRPIRPEDEPAVIAFHKGLSEETVVARYGVNRPLAERIDHARMTRICFADYDRQFALVVVKDCEDGGDREVIAMSRQVRIHASDDRHLTMVVADAWQRHGIGALLVQAQKAVAKGEGVSHLIAELPPENIGIRELLESEGFTIDEEGLRATLAIG